MADIIIRPEPTQIIVSLPGETPLYLATAAEAQRAVDAVVPLKAPQVARRAWAGPASGAAAAPAWRQLTGVDIDYIQGLSSTIARNAQDALRDVVSAKDFGVTLDGTTNDTTAVQLAINRALADGFELYFPLGTMLVDRLYVYSGLTIRGAGHATAFQQRSATTGALFNSGEAGELVDVRMRRMRFIGNKASVAAGTSGHGIAFTNSDRIQLEDIEVEDTEGHGVYVSGSGVGDETLAANLLLRVIARRCGKGEGTAGGSGITARGVHIACLGLDNLRNGFKGNGQYFGCLAKGTTLGGGFEGGFNSTSYWGASYTNCAVRNVNGSGWRFQGASDFVSLTDCSATGCGGSGIDAFGSTDRLVIKGGYYLNNGVLGARSSSVGLDGIALLKPSTQFINGVYLEGVTCRDSRAPGSKTQEFGLYVENDGSVEIGPGCDFTGNKTGPMRLRGGLNHGTISGLTQVARHPIAGTGNSAFVGPVTHTGTVASVVLWSLVIPALQDHIGAEWVARFTVETLGTVGTKRLYWQAAGAGGLIVNNSSGTNGIYALTARLVKISGTVWQVSLEFATGVITTTLGSVSSGADVTIELTALNANEADTIIVHRYTFEQVR